MIASFRKAGAEVRPVFKKKLGVTCQDDKDSVLLFSLNNFLAHYVYLILATMLTVIISKKERSDLIYTRSIVVGYLCSKLTSLPIFVELHSSFNHRLEFFFFRSMVSDSSVFVCISENLQKYVQDLAPNAKCLLGRDGHAAALAQPERLTEYYSPWSASRKIKVGYFGSFSNQKGRELIKKLIEARDDLEFHLYTLNDINENLGQHVMVGTLPHHDSLLKMRDMDFLLMTIQPQDDGRDISPYTSPLKLFEYAATGKVIIASDLVILREIVSDREVAFCDNSFESFSEKISILANNHLLREEKSRAALNFASENTWDRRAQFIVGECMKLKGL